TAAPGCAVPTRQPGEKRKMQGRHRRPQRRYSAKRVWTVFERNLSEKTTGRTASIIKNLRPGEDGGVSAPLHLQRPG
ncbi:hypothetical protein, partial [Klebsiella pneumoniae]|uniref:hypothetical protein n=2 Tax=Klebsiella pneumoniae TaxID=573 RepID=UPI0021D684CB